MKNPDRPPGRSNFSEPSLTWEASADLVVVGGGVAGRSAALSASRRGLRVVMVLEGGSTDTATQYAQGGIAVSGMTDHSSGPGSVPSDSIDSHVRDTCAAGAGLCAEEAVRSIVSGGPDALAALEAFGAVFDRGPGGGLARTREGGHSSRRIVHAGGDATGAEVQRALNAEGGEKSSLVVMFDTSAVRVLTSRGEATGILALSAEGYGVIHAPAVLLATGGLGQLYSCSTNPPGATADGIALALGAGAEIADLEFVQFHPTVLFAAGSAGRRPLVSEAVRGEGAHLVDLDGVRFMTGVHSLGDLAPRDVVSRAIAERLHSSGTDHVMLDARSIRSFHTRFPTVTASCLAVGIDPLDQLIPVAPAAHYSCGGVVTDVLGRTSVPGLFAAGEVARTGLNGANRLASNSLLEGLVVGERAGAAAQERRGRWIAQSDLALPSTRYVPRPDLQNLMTEYAGVVRDGSGLDLAASTLMSSTRDCVGAARWEDAALTTAASALVLAASKRRESRGCHTRSDYPQMSQDAPRSIGIRQTPDGELVASASIGPVRPQTMTGVS